MSNEIYIAYWSGEEPTGPGQSPTLDKTPDYIDIVPLFYVLINANGTLNFARLVLHNSEQAIKDVPASNLASARRDHLYHQNPTASHVCRQAPRNDAAVFPSL